MLICTGDKIDCIIAVCAHVLQHLALTSDKHAIFTSTCAVEKGGGAALRRCGDWSGVEHARSLAHLTCCAHMVGMRRTRAHDLFMGCAMWESPAFG